MQLSIIIVNYNTFQLTCNCIRSVIEKVTDVAYEIVLVDNASSECDPALFLHQFPGIKLIASKVNTGFAGGNNLGIKEAKGDYLLLLNSDTELLNNAPGICYKYMQTHTGVGMTAAQLIYPDGRIQYSCRRFRTISWELMEIVPIYKLLSKEKKEQLMLHHYFDHQRVVRCDWVWGTFMFFPRTIMSQLEGNKLAEDFFMYIEDVRWCWDFKNLGYEIHYLPEARVMHIHKGSTSKEKLKAVRLTGIKNHAAFMKKYYPNWKWYLFAAIFYSKQYGAYFAARLSGKL